MWMRSLSLALLMLFVSSLTQAAYDSAKTNARTGPLRILRITPAGLDIPPRHQIVFQFNRPVVPVGRMERKTSEIPITITPALKCEWRWLNTTSLACQLGRGANLIYATRYEITVRPGIRAEDGNTISNTVHHAFTTLRPRLQYTNFDKWRGPASPVIIASFNQPVTHASLLEFLSLEDEDDNRIDIEITEHPRQKNGRVWHITPTRPLKLDSDYRLMVRPGIQSRLGPVRGIEQRAAVKFTTFPSLRFVGISCQTNGGRNVTIRPDDDATARRCNPERHKTLLFTTPVTIESIRQHLHIQPSLRPDQNRDYDPWEGIHSSDRLNYPHRRGQNYSITLPVNKTYTIYTLRAKPNALRDIFDRPLTQGLAMRLATDHRLPGFTMLHGISVLEKAVDTHLPVVVTNLDTISLDYETLTAADHQGRQSRTLKVGRAPDISYYYPLKLRELIPGGVGAISGYWQTDPKVDSSNQENRWFFSQVTPFNVHVKLGHYNGLVWVTRLDNGKPVAGATIRLYTASLTNLNHSGPARMETKTDANGMARLLGMRMLDPELKLWENRRSWNGHDKPRLMLKVTQGKDMALMPILDHFSVGTGEDYYYDYSSLKKQHGHVKTWGFTAQGVYKAGDDIDYKIFVRNQGHRSLTAAPAKSYSLKVMDPTGKVVHERQHITLSSFGALHGRFSVPKSGAVGWYRFELSPSYNNETWHPLQVLVSDFTPAPFRVHTDLNDKHFRTGDTLEVTTSAKMHAGGPYANTGARVTIMVHQTPIRVTEAAARGFEYSSQMSHDHDGTQTLHTDHGSVNAEGVLTTRFTLPTTNIIHGRLGIESAVRDDRGKYVASSASARYVGRDRFVGIRLKDWVLRTRKPARLEAMVINDHGKRAPGTMIDFNIEYLETTAVRVKGAGNAYLTQYTHKWVAFKQCKARSQLKASDCTFTPKKAGRYRMSVTIQDTKGRMHQSVSTRWAAGPGAVLWEMPAGNQLEMIPEKDEYRIGETARFLVKNPYPGATALITVERYGVLQSWTQVLKNSAEIISFKISPNMAPGFYVSVAVQSPRVAKPLGKNNVDLGKPAFRIGYRKIDVRDRHKELKIRITPQQAVYKPGQRVTVDLDVSYLGRAMANTELAVAVLDESVFDLITAGRAYFDPYTGFYKLDELDLENFNLLTQLIGRRRFERKGANAGGDGLAMSAKARSGGRTRSVFKYLGYWNPTVHPDTKGHASISFTAPDNLTGWRVLVIAVNKADLIGLGDGNFKVNQATEIRPALPNQVTEGDRFEARFTIMNRTDKTRTLPVTIRATGAIAGGPTSLTLKITAKPHERVTASLPLKAGTHGTLKFHVSAGSGGDRDAMQVEIPVRRLQALETAATYGTTTQAKLEERFALPHDMRTDVGRISIVASPTVIGSLEGAFSYMRDYPYACWEQKLSKGVMAAHYQNLRPYIAKGLLWDGSKALPQATLDIAANYQAPNGGMVYYIAQNRYADPYLSAYTALAFNWLRASGHSVPKDVEERLHNYLLHMLRRDVFPDFYTRGMGSSVRAVALAALAEHGKIRLSDLHRYRDHVPQMNLFGKAHYLMALTRVKGTASMQRELLDILYAHGNETGGKFIFSEDFDSAWRRMLGSSLRSNCAVLSAFLDAEDPRRGGQDATDVPFKLVRTLTQKRKRSGRWENTQENMFCMNALTRFARAYEKDKPAMRLTTTIGETQAGSARFNDFRDKPVEFNRPIKTGDPGRKLTARIDKAGPGRYYYAARLFYSPKQPKKDRANAGIDIRREYSVERDGKWVLLESPMTIRRGELVRVDIFLSLPAARNFVVVADPVPGGLEPVNRNLGTASKVDAAKAKMTYAGGSFWWHYRDWRAYGFSFWSFYHQELRHHAAQFYSEYLPAGNYHLSYVAQAIAPGEFAVMPVHSEEMYDPDVFGRGLPAVLKVEP